MSCVMEGLFEQVTLTVRPGLGILMTDLLAERHHSGRQSDRHLLPTPHHAKGAAISPIPYFDANALVETIWDESRI